MADTTAQAEWKKHVRENNSIVTKLMTGQARMSKKCLKCGEERGTFEPFMVLQLPLPNEPNRLMRVVLVRWPEAGSSGDGRMIEQWGLFVRKDGNCNDLKMSIEHACGMHHNRIVLAQV